MEEPLSAAEGAVRVRVAPTGNSCRCGTAAGGADTSGERPEGVRRTPGTTRAPDAAEPEAAEREAAEPDAAER
ncbi:hypothetical protein [Streptomyces alboniger]|uniref:Uncharacterized protein n=1 Tax=Streptomyces alboniger TaxID=132473 RepID=A0A5J6HQ70_STRAD|nr:hypothetical protein [Streptomyces alboniger]QEV20824.1 hypothetical protein CP975_27685 [Streptomyces alboniger]